MSTTNLQKRWETNIGINTIELFVDCINKNKSLDNVIGLEKYLGKWDLRGVNLTPKLNVNNFKFKNCILDSIDFSYSKLNNTFFQNCTLNNCLFENATLKETTIICSNLTNCLFKTCNLTYSRLNDNIMDNSGLYKSVFFINCNFSESNFCFPKVEKCTFQNCNFKAFDFDGARLDDCKFIGEVDSCWFGGYSLNATKSILGVFNRFDPLKFKNKMNNIDFLDAKLIGVSFRNNINIDNCFFPKENYHILFNLISSFELLKKTINENWEGDNKKFALQLIDKVYYRKEYYEQDFVFIDKHMLIELFGDQFANKFFDLLLGLIK
jgi:uncharacterized protein YjbI with pentapeptide repeats